MRTPPTSSRIIRINGINDIFCYLICAHIESGGYLLSSHCDGEARDWESERKTLVSFAPLNNNGNTNQRKRKRTREKLHSVWIWIYLFMFILPMRSNWQIHTSCDPYSAIACACSWRTCQFHFHWRQNSRENYIFGSVRSNGQLNEREHTKSIHSPSTIHIHKLKKKYTFVPNTGYRRPKEQNVWPSEAVHPVITIFLCFARSQSVFSLSHFGQSTRNGIVPFRYIVRTFHRSSHRVYELMWIMLMTLLAPETKIRTENPWSQMAVGSGHLGSLVNLFEEYWSQRNEFPNHIIQRRIKRCSSLTISAVLMVLYFSPRFTNPDCK